ncbi:MAG: HAD-IA family hydrolase [Kiritimatiellae bacterium]|nr:HAD-IA family hydrolase [Verrucomicrobiota bacterium]MCG2679598.1 HAD-IA family hydrolase [Kiritimatiellia bacterium]
MSMGNISTILGVILDMDGVLCDSEPFIGEAAGRMFHERYQIKVKPADFKLFVGMGENRYLSGVAERHGIRLALESDKARTYAIYLDIIKGRLKPLPGAADFIAACRQHGLKLAVATSADLIKLQGNLNEIRIPVQMFDATVTGSEVERKKPHPDLFLAAAQKIKIHSGHCLVIEDAPSGIKAATRAGMLSWGLTTSFSSRALTRAGARWTAPDLAHVPPELFRSRK